MSMQVMV